MLHFGMRMPFYYMALYGSVMIVAVLALRALLRNKLPKFVFPVLWCVVLVRFLIPFSVSSPLSLPVPPNLLSSYMIPMGLGVMEVTAATEDIPAEQEVVPGSDMQSPVSSVKEDNVVATFASEESVGGREMFFTDRFEWRRLPYAVYLPGVAVTAGILAGQKYRYSKRLRGSLLMENNETVNAMLRDLGMGHVLVFTNDEIASPLVCGLLNSRIYLPTGMDFGNKVLLGHVLAHEIMHVKRRDNLLKCVMVIALVLNWYNPLMWIMAKCLPSDLEAACDEAVLKTLGGEERKSYAFSLLAMAVSANRTTLLYSAFSKTEVEKRVKNIVQYKKAPLFVLLFSVLFVMGSTVVFATGGQAPFSSYLTGFCFSSNCRWGVRVTLNRDIFLGEDPQRRAEDAVIDILRTDTAGDPEILDREIRKALAEEFDVERGAFETDISLVLDDEELKAEYEAAGITLGEDGFLLYGGEEIRAFEDRMAGFYRSREEGTVDISVVRDRLGIVTSVTVLREGDLQYDERTRRMENDRARSSEPGMQIQSGETVFLESGRKDGL